MPRGGPGKLKAKLRVPGFAFYRWECHRYRGPESGRRSCLQCSKPFRSTGAWNRTCPYCSERGEPPSAEFRLTPAEMARLDVFLARPGLLLRLARGGT